MSTKMNCYVRALFLLVWLARIVQPLPDPIQFGGDKYLMSAAGPGDGFYLGCGDDQNCSILDISGAQEHDGWIVDNKTDGTVRFYIRDGSWALDVKDNGQNIFADDVKSDSNGGEIWELYSIADGTYQIYNPFWNSSLDVENGDTPFVNPNSSDNLLGQHWYFRSVEPQVTVTSTTTSTSTVNSYAISTTTTTVTVCSGKTTSAPTLKKRGAEILSTTTQTIWSTSFITVTEESSTSVITSTATVSSCSPVTSGSSSSKKPLPTAASSSVSLTPPSSVSWIPGAVMVLLLESPVSALASYCVLGGLSTLFLHFQ